MMLAGRKVACGMEPQSSVGVPPCSRLFPTRWTMSDKGLLKAKTMFMIGGTKNRMQIIVVVTDGRASNRWKARKAANEVRAAGIRVILVPVGGAALRQEKEMCRWASKPCNENMIKTPSWRMP